MMFLLAAIASAAGVAATPSLPPAWQAWRAVAPIRTTASDAGLRRFALPTGVYGLSRSDLADLRIIDDVGAEVPFAIDQRQASTVVDWTSAPLSEQGFVRGQYTQAVADAGSSGILHNTLEIETTADDFSAWVEVAASDDERTWRIVRDKAPIYRFSSDALEGNLTVRFEPTRDRWLRVRVLSGTGEFAISGCRVANELAIVPELAVVAPKLTRTGSAIPSQTRWSADLGAPNIPVSTVRFRTSSAEFYRTVDVAVSADGSSWTDAGQGDIYRDSRAGTSLDVRFPEARGRFYRVTVFNRSDRPLSDVVVSLLATPRYASFRAARGRSYRLLYANPKAQAPHYDFETLTTADDRLSAIVVRLGAAEIAPPPPVVVPWTESHAYVLWIALLLAVGVLAWLAIGAMRGDK